MQRNSLISWQLVEMENDKNKKIDEIYEWQKKNKKKKLKQKLKTQKKQLIN